MISLQYQYIDTIGTRSWEAHSDSLIRLAEAVDSYRYWNRERLTSLQSDKLRFLGEGIRGSGRALATVTAVGLIASLDRELKRLQQLIDGVEVFLEDSDRSRELISHLSLVFNLATTISRVILPLLG
jgi:hypothetical protein